MYISPINKKYFKNIQNLDIEIKGPAFNQVVYEEKAGSITDSMSRKPQALACGMN